jgi:hypothetical protein
VVVAVINGKLDAQLRNAYEVALLFVALAHSVSTDVVPELHQQELRDEYLLRVCDDDVVRELLWREVYTYGR